MSSSQSKSKISVPFFEKDTCRSSCCSGTTTNTEAGSTTDVVLDVTLALVTTEVVCDWGILFPMPLLEMDDVELAEDAEEDELTEDLQQDELRLLDLFTGTMDPCRLPSRFRPMVFRNSRMTWSSHT